MLKMVAIVLAGLPTVEWFAPEQSSGTFDSPGIGHIAVIPDLCRYSRLVEAGYRALHIVNDINLMHHISTLIIDEMRMSICLQSSPLAFLSSKIIVLCSHKLAGK
jgi:hypothetical protein